MTMRLYQYIGPATTLPLANGDELVLVSGKRIEVESSRDVKRLVNEGRLLPLRRDKERSERRRARRRDEERSKRA